MIKLLSNSIESSNFTVNCDKTKVWEKKLFSFHLVMHFSLLAFKALSFAISISNVNCVNISFKDRVKDRYKKGQKGLEVKDR